MGEIVLKRCVLLFFTLVFLFSSVTPTFASAKNKKNEEGMSYGEIEEASVKDFEVKENILLAIENLPDETIKQGPEEVAAYFSEETGYYVYVDENEVIRFEDDSISPMFNVWGCIGAVGVALVSNGIPLAKLGKIKDALNVLGGTVEAVKK